MFSLSVPESCTLWPRLTQYEPFDVPEGSGEPLFNLELVRDTYEPLADRELVYDAPTEEGETVIKLYHNGDGGWDFDMSPDKNIPFRSHMRSTEDFSSAVLMLDNRKSGKAFFFLARSGTGKSTHSSLWLEHVPGTELMNDDNPIVRVWPDGRIIAYGSPWSGKTPCYRNVEAPVGAFVRIRRCPENKIAPLGLLESYALLYSSSSGFKADKAIADGLHSTLERIVTTTPCYVLDCRPDEEAARVCSAEVLK